MRVLMVGVDKSTKGGMWTVVENYLNSEDFLNETNLTYIPTSITGCPIPSRIIFTLKSYIKIKKEFKNKKFDILHVHMSERSSIYRKGIIMKYAKKKGSKIVLHMHGAEFEVLYKKMNEKKKKKVRDILNLADKILILGEYWHEFIGSLLNDTSKVKVVYNAVNVPTEYQYNSFANSVLFLGAISKRKGIYDFIEALSEKKEQLEGICTVDIYGPEAEGNINEVIEINGLSSWVKYRGWLDKEHKSDVLKNTAVNVLPSYNEGLPMTILEAMSYGVPTITTNVAAIPEAVNNKNGIIIKPGDSKSLGNAIVDLIVNEKKRLNLSKNAYLDAKNRFSVETHFDVIYKIYKELL